MSKGDMDRTQKRFTILSLKYDFYIKPAWLGYAFRNPLYIVANWKYPEKTSMSLGDLDRTHKARLKHFDPYGWPWPWEGVTDSKLLHIVSMTIF